MGPAAASSTPAGGPNTCLYICTCIYIIIIQGGVMSCIVLRMRIKMKMKTQGYDEGEDEEDDDEDKDEDDGG